MTTQVNKSQPLMADALLQRPSLVRCLDVIAALLQGLFCNGVESLGSGKAENGGAWLFTCFNV